MGFGLFEHLLVEVVVGVVPFQDLPPQLLALRLPLSAHLLQFCLLLRNQRLQFLQGSCVHFCLSLHFLQVFLLHAFQFQMVGCLDALQLVLESLFS